MSPLAKLNVGTLFGFICLILLTNAAGLGGAAFRSPDLASAGLTAPQLTL